MKKSESLTLFKSINEPVGAGSNAKRQMMSAGNTPSDHKDGPNINGAQCGKCGHKHAPGSVCEASKSILDQLFKAETTKPGPPDPPKPGKGKVGKDSEENKTTVGGGGSTKGNPYHDESGKFTTKDNASIVSQTGTGRKDEGEATSHPGVKKVGGEEEKTSKEDKDPDLSATGTGGGEVEDYDAAEQQKQDILQQFLAQNEARKEKEGQESITEGAIEGRLGKEGRAKQEVDEYQRQAMEETPEKYERKNLKPEAGDPHDAAHSKMARAYQDKAEREALAAGADPTEAAVAGHEAWQESAAAFDEAREQGISPEEVETDEDIKELAEMNRIRKEKTNLSDEEKDSRQQEARELLDEMNKPNQEGQQPSPGMEEGRDTIVDDPSKTPGREGEQEKDPGFDTPAVGFGGKGKIKEKDEKFQVPFSQYYGAGASMGGAAMGSEAAGGVAPMSSFTAQRAHGLLNADLSPHTQHTFTSAPHMSSHYLKSILDKLDIKK